MVWSACSSWGTRVVTLVVTVILSRLLMPKDFGLVALASVFIAFLSVFQDQGLSDAIVQAPSLDDRYLSTAFWSNVVFGLLLFGGSLVSANQIALLFDEARLAPIIRCLAATFLLNGLIGVHQAVLRRRLEFRTLAVRSLFSILVSGTVALGMAWSGYGVWSLVVKVLVEQTLGVLILWTAVDWRPTFQFSPVCFRQLFSYGINIVGSNFVDFFSRRSDDFLIGRFLGTTALGYYSLGYNLLMVLTDIVIVVPTSVLFPVFSRLQGDALRLQRWIYGAAQLLSLCALPVFWGLVAIAPDLIPFVFGSQWRPSVPVTQILMLVAVVHSTFYLFGSILKSLGKPSWRLAILTIVSLLNVVGFSVVVRWGIVAVAGSYLAVACLMFPFYFLAVRCCTGIHLGQYLALQAPALASSSIMAIVLLGLRPLQPETLPTAVWLPLLVLVGAVIYFAALFAMRRRLAPQVQEQVLSMARSMGERVGLRAAKGINPVP